MNPIDQAALALWRRFRDAIETGAMADPARYRPLNEALLQPLMDFFHGTRSAIDWGRSEEVLETHRVEERVHFVLPLTDTRGQQTPPFCFTLVVEGDQWYVQHLENITLRLDQLGEPPITEFPGSEHEAWIRAEIKASEDVRLYAFLAREKGSEFALDWFKDGAGYAMAARAWVPLVPPHRALVLYLCWDLARLRGETVTLEALNDDSARVRFTPRAFALYRQAKHLSQQVSLEDYRCLFETVWRDRACHGGWNLHICYEGEVCLFQFARKRAGM